MKSLKPKHFTTALAAIVVLISTGLLVRDRFVNSTASVPVEVISSFETGRREVFIDGTKIWLDDRTEVKVIYDDLEFITDAIELNVIQGRIVIDDQASIKTRELTARIDGKVSFTHYSWENKIEISIFNGSAEIIGVGRVEAGKTMSVSTLPPYNPTYTDFTPEKSSAAEFYKKISP